MSTLHIPIEEVARPDAEQNAQGDHPCFLCGRATDGTRSVHLATFGALVPTTEVLEADEDQGWFDIGPECARKLPRTHWTTEEVT
jgi:hypothetical protein